MNLSGLTGRWTRLVVALPAILAGSVLLSRPAPAEPLENRIAVFAALDKITGDITTLKVPVNGTAKFGTFRITPRTCHTRPPTEEPRTMAFVEIEEFTYDRKHRRVFTGWMNAESPGLHAVEHPLFDVWLTGCAEPLQAQADGAGVSSTEGGKENGTEAPTGKEAPAVPLPSVLSPGGQP